MKYQNKLLSLLITGIAASFINVNIQAEESPAKGEQSGIYIGKLEIQPAIIESAKESKKELSLKKTAQSLDTQLISALSATRVFQIVERKRKADIEQEQGFSATAVDLTDKDAAQLGKMAGAKYALLPQIDGFEDLVDIREYKDIERYSMRRKLYMSVTVTIVDTTTGKTLPDVANVQLSKEEVVKNARDKKFLEGSSSLNVELAKNIANNLCMDIIALIRPAKVLTITGKQVLINRGIPAGFKKGVNIEFFAYEEVKDEDTSEAFRNEVLVGKGIITSTDAKQSYAKIEGEDRGITKGCIVKIIKVETGTESIPASAPGGSFPAEPSPRAPVETTPGSSDKPIQFDTNDTITINTASKEAEKTSPAKGTNK